MSIFKLLGCLIKLAILGGILYGIYWLLNLFGVHLF